MWSYLLLFMCQGMYALYSVRFRRKKCICFYCQSVSHNNKFVMCFLWRVWKIAVVQCAVPNSQMNFLNVHNCCYQSIHHHRPAIPIKMNINGSTKDTMVCILKIQNPFLSLSFLLEFKYNFCPLWFCKIGWWQYDERTCQEIEEAYKNAQKQCTILVAGYLYIVDFDQMLQKRQTDPARKRQVKRKIWLFLSLKWMDFFKMPWNFCFHRGFGQCTEKGCSRSTIVVSFNT